MASNLGRWVSASVLDARPDWTRRPDSIGQWSEAGQPLGWMLEARNRP